MPLTGNVSSDISEMSHSSGHKKRMQKHGKKTAHKMEVAAAMREHEKKGKRKSSKSGRRGGRY
jgi:hypothetical protein